ncbi:MAG: ATP phosphoribosyltransferase regulatory subunit [Bacillota bacterium]
MVIGDGGLDAWLDRVACVRAAESVLREVFLDRGYREVNLPAIEEAEDRLVPRGGGQGGFAGGAGPAAARDGEGAYRFLDQEGRVWALRADVTPGLARLLWSRDADGPRPRRLFYMAEVYRRVPGQRGPVALLQVGVEVVGTRGPGEDAGILSLAAVALRSLGLTRFQLSVGHVGLLKEILSEAGLGPEERDQILAALQARDYVKLHSLIAAVLPEKEAHRLTQFLTWRGRAAALLGVLPALGIPGDKARAALEDLRGLLEACGEENNVFVDLGLVRDRTYYTGMVFEMCVPGLSQPAGGGGRYDGVLSPEPATGFAFDLGAVLAVAPVGAATGPAGGRGPWPAVTVGGRLQVAAIH